MCSSPCELTSARGQELFKILTSRGILSEPDAEAAVYGLEDIAASITKVYGDPIPRILNDPNATAEAIRDLFRDIREKF